MRVSNRHQRSLGTRAAYFDSLERRQLLAATSGLPIELHVWAGATWTSDSLDRAVQPGDSVSGTRTPAGYRAGGAFGLAPTITLGSDVAIAGTTDDALFRVQRQAYALTFASPAANGDYVAIVEFAEPDAAAVVGSRVFDITAEGRPFATHVDPAAILGGPDAAIALAGRVTIADGQFDLSFAATAGQAIVSSVTLVPTAIPDATTAAFDVSNHTEVQRTLLGEAGLAAIGRAIFGYANEQRNNMPPDLGFLAVDQDVPLADFVDPRGPSRAPRGTLSDLERQAVVRSLGDYVYVRSSKLPTRNSATTVIAYENPTRVAGDLNALYADGHVATVARAALGAAVGFDPTLPPTSTAAPSPALKQDPVIGQSRRNANGLITALYAYANDHRLALPPSLGTLASDSYVTDLSLFVDPRLGHVAPNATAWTPDQRSAWVDANADYDYRPSDRANASNLSPNVPLIFERANDLDAGRLTGGLVIGFGGGDTVYQEARWARETLAAIGAADPRMGVLMGSVFDDVDGDGTPQSVAAEPIVSGYTVFVDLDGDGVRDADEPSQISVDGAGFRFDGLARGTYTIRVDATASQRTTRAAMAGVSEATPGASGLLVGVHDDVQLTTLTGVAFDDANANGTRDAGEAGATYATAYVDLNGNGKPDAGEPTGVPDAATARVVLRIPNPSGTRATYTVRLLLPAGATQIAPAASGNVVGLDLGSARAIAQIKFAPRVGYAARMIGGLFQGSNDAAFATATTLYTIAAAPAVGALTTANLSNATAYRYVRYVAPAGSYGNVAELQFFGAAATTTPAKLAGTTIGTAGSYNNNGNTIGKATDGDLNTFFDGAAANGNVVGLDLGTARVIRQIAYAPRNGFAARMIGGVFQGSNDAAFASATTLLTITAAPATGVLTMATITNATVYRYVRYVAPPGSYGNVGEVQFFG